MMQQFRKKIGDKLCNLFYVTLYPLPSQSEDQFEIFTKNLKLSLDTISANKSLLTVALGS